MRSMDLIDAAIDASMQSMVCIDADKDGMDAIHGCHELAVLVHLRGILAHRYNPWISLIGWIYALTDPWLPSTRDFLASMQSMVVIDSARGGIDASRNEVRSATFFPERDPRHGRARIANLRSANLRFAIRKPQPQL